MKKLILLALVVLMMAGCDFKNPDGSYDTSRSVRFETILIDSCEYITISGYGYNTLTHKGNCRFCKERRQKELEQSKKLK